MSKVPNYGIFEPETGTLELYHLGNNGRYQMESGTEDGRFWLQEMELFLGVWTGERENRSGHWLRWWDEQENLLLWGTEKVAKLAAQLRAAGIEPEV